MKRNLIIFGSSRSGKTTLAKKIAKEFNFNYIAVDRIVTGFQYGMPELGISHEDRTGKTVELLSPFLLNFIKSLDSSNLKQDDIFYVFEGAYFNIEECFQFFRKRNILIIILLQTELNEYELFNNIRKYDCESEWTAKMSDVDLIDYCKNVVEFNKYIKNICEQHNFKYYDTSFNRDVIIDKVIDEIWGIFDNEEDSKI